MINNSEINLETLGFVSLPGNDFRDNEDAIGFANNAVWVLDGATSVSNTSNNPTDGFVFTHAINRHLSNLLKEQIILPEALAQAILLTNQELEYPWINSKGYELPSAAGILIQLVDTQLEYLVFGDCNLVLTMPNQKTLRITDPALNKFDNKSIEMVKQTLQQHPQLSLGEARKLNLSILREHRSKANQIDGYNVITPHGFGVNPIHGYLDVVAGTRILLTSDGYSRIEDLFHYQDLKNIRTVNELQNLAHKLREFETIDIRGEK